MLRRRDIRLGEKGGSRIGPTKRGKGVKIMAIVERHGLPVAICTESASPAECKLVQMLFSFMFIDDLPEILIGDKAYDSDELDQNLLEQGVCMVAPHRNGRKPENKTQDGRYLRRYKRRWKVERFFSWLHNFRRTVVRWERHAENYMAFVQLACVLILMRHL